MTLRVQDYFDRMMRERARYTLDREPVDLLDFLKINADSLAAEEIFAIGNMRPGDSLVLGGGAAATFTLSRLDDATPGGTCGACEARLVCPHCE